MVDTPGNSGGPRSASAIAVASRNRPPLQFGFPQVNIVRQICLINGTFPGNGTLFRQPFRLNSLRKSRNPIPLVWTAPCLISGHETEDKTSNERDQLGLI